jgi:hypothetical protein
VLIRSTDEINSSRENAISKCFSLLGGLLKKYQKTASRCHKGLDCDAIVLGGLIIRLKSMDCYPLPDRPYEGFSVKDLSQKLCDMSVPTLCDIMQCRHSCGQRCDNKPSISPHIKSIQVRLVGLERSRKRKSIT